MHKANCGHLFILLSKFLLKVCSVPNTVCWEYSKNISPYSEGPNLAGKYSCQQ